TGHDAHITDVLGASIGGGNIRILELNGMRVEFSGDYPTLIVRHRDVPGVINHVTLVLAKEKVNIAFMQVFRHVRNLDAYMIIETDSPVSQHVCELIQNWSEEVTEVKSV
ncbi:MAG: ACT domain-containing protein, partial [Clostridiales bacterium]|nr:ACT domain-containing protein [Clostridiales bacterium]